MHQQVDHVDRPRERAGSQHLQLLPDMRLGKEGRKTERQAGEDDDAPGEIVERGQHEGHGAPLILEFSNIVIGMADRPVQGAFCRPIRVGNTK